MATTRSLGRCPDCGSEIPTARLIIEYDRGDARAAYAECPDCRAVVRPR